MIRRVQTATILFAASQLMLAVVLALGILTEDGDPLNSLFVRNNIWTLIVAAQVLAVSAGLWEGATGEADRSRLVACAIGPIALAAFLMASAFYWGGPPSIVTALVVLPTVMLVVAFFAPSWVAVLVGKVRLRNV